MLSRILKKELPEEVKMLMYKILSPLLPPNRIGELGEYKINIQLDHVIFTPYAIFVIETKYYAGTIYGDRSRAKWSVNGKFPMMNPFNQNYGHIQVIKGVLETVDEKEFVSMVSFTKDGYLK